MIVYDILLIINQFSLIKNRNVTIYKNGTIKLSGKKMGGEKDDEDIQRQHCIGGNQ